MRRDTLEKETRSCDNIEQYVKDLLEDIQNNIYRKACDFRSQHIIEVDSYDEFKEKIEEGGFILAHWDPVRPKPKLESKKRPKLRYVVFRSTGIRRREYVW